uniref:bcl-2-binding component 3 n=1 Tax=Doryrhamphus excisus TaxID=161450 RepID=UPI0025AE0751|nr:bcl-2-binding component 3 [Doryrhamphus excisus]
MSAGRRRSPSGGNTQHPSQQGRRKVPGTTEMARAETTEGVSAAAAGGANGPLPQNHHSSSSALPNTQHPHSPPLPTSLPGPTPQTPSPPLSPAQSDERQDQGALLRRRPLPELPPQDEHESADPLPTPWLDTTAMGQQLKTIGDDFNASVLRAHDSAYWQYWRGFRRGLVTLVRALDRLV